MVGVIFGIAVVFFSFLYIFTLNPTELEIFLNGLFPGPTLFAIVFFGIIIFSLLIAYFVAKLEGKYLSASTYLAAIIALVILLVIIVMLGGFASLFLAKVL